MAITEIEISNGRRVLLDARELRHIGGRFLVAHIDAVPMLLFENVVLLGTEKEPTKLLLALW